MNYDISNQEFQLLADFIYKEIGISLSIQKKTLVKGRLSKRLRHLNLNTFREYYDYLLRDKSGEELLMLTNEISTNVTSFFREPNQWIYLEEELEYQIKNNKEKKLRIWSSACSSGQEPYTIIMFLMNNIKDIRKWDIKILATDISEEILLKAQEGIYKQSDIQGLPLQMQKHYFNYNKKNNTYEIKKELKDYITFRSFNLVLGNYSILKNETFDWIFCRNVMIYFDNPTKQKVVSNLLSKLKKMGHFLIGHSESLVTIGDKKDSNIELKESSIYRKRK